MKHAHIVEFKPGDARGTVYDTLTGIEFDVRQDGVVWNVNDDDGRNFRAFTIQRALRKAIGANS